MRNSLSGDRLVGLLKIASEDPLNGTRNHLRVNSVDHVLKVCISFREKGFLNNSEVSNADTLDLINQLLIYCIFYLRMQIFDH